MAKMIPSAVSPGTESRAEKDLFHEFRRQLGDTFTVFHSFGILERRRGMGNINREIDFLVVSPRGIIALEVKGGRIAYRGGEKQWLQNGRPMKQSPFDQAKDNKYAVRDFLKGRGIHTGHIVFAHAVAFPDVPREIRDLPADASVDITITGQEIPFLSEKVEAVLRFWQESHSRPMSDRELQATLAALTPEFEYGASLVDRIQAADRQIFQLTEGQWRILDALCEQKRVLVKGCAGSGKTILALRKARELAAEGKKVLLLCYNKPLGLSLRDSIEGEPGGITAAHYHHFCMQMLEEAGIEPQVPDRDGSDFWDVELPDRFDQWLQENPITYDAIIVDEGQDFRMTYWATIEKMLRPESHLYIFYDPDQNLRKTHLQFPIDSSPVILSDNCRNTLRIGTELKKLTSQKMRLRDEAPEGDPIHEVRCRSDRDLRKALGQSLHRLIAEGGMPRENVVVLGGHKLERTSLGKDPRIGNFRIVERPTPETQGPDVVGYYTYIGFKGLEADAVILFGVNPRDRAWSNPNALYTAMSRAKFVLHVLHRED